MEQPHPVPYWRAESQEVVRPYQKGLHLLGEALEFSFHRLESVQIDSAKLQGAEGRAVLPILASRAIATVDGIHALLAQGGTEQAEILIRTLIDLQADAHLLVAREEAFSFYADWAIVEQARMALVMRTDEIVRADRDLVERRKELARELILRLRSHDEAASDELEGKDLDEVLAGFCRSRFSSRRPQSWRLGYASKLGFSGEDVRQIVIARALRVFESVDLPDEVRLQFERIFERELVLLFGHLSGEVHNSPLAISKLIDEKSWTISVHGDIDGLPRPLASAFLHLMRIMLLFEDEWGDQEGVAEWSDRSIAIVSWMESLDSSGT